jgi:hypothetical protein
MICFKNATSSDIDEINDIIKRNGIEAKMDSSFFNGQNKIIMSDGVLFIKHYIKPDICSAHIVIDKAKRKSPEIKERMQKLIDEVLESGCRLVGFIKKENVPAKVLAASFGMKKVNTFEKYDIYERIVN